MYNNYYGYYCHNIIAIIFIIIAISIKVNKVFRAFALQ